MEQWRAYDGRGLKAPADCVDFAVVDEASGKEIARVWLAEDARRIAEMAREIERLKAATRAVNTELWWCAIQLGCNWKDRDWREKSSVGRAYDEAVAALSPAPTSTDLEHRE